MLVANLANSDSAGTYGAVAQHYACYPEPVDFATDFNIQLHQDRLRDRNTTGVERSVELLVQAPFQHDAGQKISPEATRQSALHLDYLKREFGLVARHWSRDRAVSRVYCHVPAASAGELIRLVRESFALRTRGDYTIDTDPYDLCLDRLARLAEQGFSHLRVATRAGVFADRAQDLNQIVNDAHRIGFRTVDIVYESTGEKSAHFLRQVRRLIAAGPDRVLLHRCGRTFSSEPGVLRIVVESFEAAGYIYLGMDHFVRYHDNLAVARRRGRLGYDLCGYVAGGCGDALGLGLAAVSRLGPVYSQNEQGWTRYCAALDRGCLPIQRGIVSSADDLVRRGVIHALICHLEVSFEPINIAYLIDFKQYFAPELALLERYAHNGMIELGDDCITVTTTGRLLLPAICEVFDAYHR